MKFTPDAKLDALGMIFPYPMTETSKLIKQVKEGNVRAISADDAVISFMFEKGTKTILGIN